MLCMESSKKKVFVVGWRAENAEKQLHWPVSLIFMMFCAVRWVSFIYSFLSKAKKKFAFSFRS